MAGCHGGGLGQNEGMKRTLLFALALIAAVPVYGVAQDGLDSDTTIREFFDWLGAAVASLTHYAVASLTHHREQL